MNPLPTERDACGIGFVADAQGRPSREMVDLALQALTRLRHRGALSADAKTGDGAGLLVPLAREFWRRVTGAASGSPSGDRDVGVAMCFLSTDPAEQAAAREALVQGCKEEDLEVIGWREVPTDPSRIGDMARTSMPVIAQLLVQQPAGDDGDAERRAYRARRRAMRTMEGRGRFYVASFSFRTVLYKALAAADQLAAFYPDLGEPDFVAPFAIFHQRFSTNTLPTWERAQPFRFLCHNGEINAIEGNERWMASRNCLGAEPVGLADDEDLLRPVLDPTDSDSGRLDSALELLIRGGRDIRHSLAMLIPEAWEHVRDLDPAVRDFYRYHACLMEPWDGPAGLCVTDGVRVTAILDRNGLRPLRWLACEDGLVVVASEVGAVDTSGRGTVRRGRLGPGQMLCVDPEAGGLQLDAAIKESLADRAPYGKWVEDGIWMLPAGDPIIDPRPGTKRRQVAYGHTREEAAMIVKTMALDAKEPTFSMGDDTPIPPLASVPRPVHHFLRQRFAQVTNPPIDHLRERIVMSLRTFLGPRDDILLEREEAAHLAELPSFFVYPSTLAVVSGRQGPGLFEPHHLDATFAADDGPLGLREALRRLADEAGEAVRAGSGVLVVDDTGWKADGDRVPVPILLAVGAVHQRLVRDRTRSLCSIVVDTDEVRDVHHACTLLGFGADAICPRLTLEAIAELIDAPLSDDDDEEEATTSLTSTAAQERYQAALEDGVLKVMGKMGISTVDSYRGAQIFEIIGLDDEVVDLCFRGTATAVSGIGFDALGEQAVQRFEQAAKSDRLVTPGIFRHRKGGEYHASNPTVIEALHADTLAEPDEAVAGNGTSGNGSSGNGAAGDGQAVSILTREMRAAHVLQQALREESFERYQEFARLVHERPLTTLHDLLEWVPVADPVPLDEVEPAREIVRHFSTGAMSHGSIGAEAHETLAVAMNMIGGRSNCGEGGESPARYRTRGTTRDRNSAIKQIASGRFGVTPEYCVFADELNIKMAQGSKPGEGGQIPGNKVTEEIAGLRHTQPGVTLISPPPHHDIYSIEDLAQLIFDLKQVNSAADVSVKLVAEAGVGTVAAGVVKALADVVQISGAEGGTGASPLSSIKHAGLPWEVGLAETQRVLVENGLRDRVRLRVDGGFKTGREVLVAALLGADEYSFGTAAMLAEGCIMVRACHRDTCPTGIATQRPHLRAKFQGTPEGVATYFLQVAEEVRRCLAALGLRSITDAVGRVDLLRQRDAAPHVDLAHLLAPVGGPAALRFIAGTPLQRPRSELGDRLLTDAFRAVWEGDHEELSYDIGNADRTVGAALGGAIALEFGAERPPGTVRATFTGSAGQSFGAFLTEGIELVLLGDANDYVGKGMGGGRIVIRPPADDAGAPYLVGNTVLYGATRGELHVSGRAGERFAVRNSGAVAVVEGVGHHACEYMTGGTVVVLGPVGYNVGAGMTGGEVFVYDPHSRLAGRLNRGLVDAVRPGTSDLERLQELVDQHRRLTDSEVADALLANWADVEDRFWRVIPLTEVRRIESMQESVTGTPS